MQAAMGGSIVDFAWLIRALRDRRYDGAVAIEYFSGFDKGFESTCTLRDLLAGMGVET
jgi:sugar phosphate isomerase/epimerase